MAASDCFVCRGTGQVDVQGKAQRCAYCQGVSAISLDGLRGAPEPESPAEPATIFKWGVNIGVKEVRLEANTDDVPMLTVDNINGKSAPQTLRFNSRKEWAELKLKVEAMWNAYEKRGRE